MQQHFQQDKLIVRERQQRVLELALVRREMNETNRIIKRQWRAIRGQETHVAGGTHAANTTQQLQHETSQRRRIHRVPLRLRIHGHKSRTHRVIAHVNRRTANRLAAPKETYFTRDNDAIAGEKLLDKPRLIKKRDTNHGTRIVAHHEHRVLTLLHAGGANRRRHLLLR